MYAFKFQSYLYGIEIKSLSCAACKGVMFQSYLYGIEITINTAKKEVILQFQSYLYGIEISLVILIVFFTNRFNRTFMELKFLFL